jgi:hypothetical protein
MQFFAKHPTGSDLFTALALNNLTVTGEGTIHTAPYFADFTRLL